MKIYVVVFCVVVVSIVGSFYSTHLLSAGVDEMMAGYSVLVKNVDQEAWQEAAEDFERLEKLWEEKKNLWSVLIDHQILDNINTTLVRSQKYIEIHERAMALGELAVLEIMLEHITVGEQVDLKNIF